MLIYVFTVGFVVYKSNVLLNHLDNSLQSGMLLTDYDDLPNADNFSIFIQTMDVQTHLPEKIDLDELK